MLAGKARHKVRARVFHRRKRLERHDGINAARTNENSAGIVKFEFDQTLDNRMIQFIGRHLPPRQAHTQDNLKRVRPILQASTLAEG